MFYFLRQNILEPLGLIEITGHTPETSSFSWIAGEKFTQPLLSQTLLLDPNYGDKLPDFFDTTIPVMSERLIAFLLGYGIDNIDTYPVVLRNKISGEEILGYSAVNVIGCINATKLEDSQYRLRFGKPYFTGRISLDETLLQDKYFFRLLYGPGFIVIAQDIADALGKETWTGILIQPTEDYAGA